MCTCVTLRSTHPHQVTLHLSFYQVPISKTMLEAMKTPMRCCFPRPSSPCGGQGPCWPFWQHTLVFLCLEMQTMIILGIKSGLAFFHRVNTDCVNSACPSERTVANASGSECPQLVVWEIILYFPAHKANKIVIRSRLVKYNYLKRDH